MLDASLIESYLRQLAPEQLPAILAGFFPQGATTSEQIAAIESALRGPMGASVRSAMGKWIVEQLVPVPSLVPPTYEHWRAPVRDAMLFVVSHLSTPRLAPKLLEQLQLPPRTRPETRLLRLISEVPGLQKLGQVIARNRKLRPALRAELSRLENGIHDVEAKDMVAIIQRQLGAQISRFQVVIRPKLLSEASVSAVVPFTWRNPETRRRERGVFKVRKPHVPAYFAEDMEMLQRLAQFFGTRDHTYGLPPHLIADTFRKVRRLLQHEVNFAREQKTLREAWELYQSVPGVRVPRLIAPLCTPGITAITQEQGIKITDAAARSPAYARGRIADQLIDAIIAVPLFSAAEQSLFHGDPHAGNLLYNRRTGELIMIDWALREHLSRQQRRHLAILFATVALRDPVGATREVAALAQPTVRRHSPQEALLRRHVSEFLDELPLVHVPSAVDAMQLLERVAVKGVRFPGPLIILSKVLFTLDGILHDIGGSSAPMGLVFARHVVRRSLTRRRLFDSLLTTRDWLDLQCSALLYGSRLGVRCQQALLERVLPHSSRDVVAASA